MIGLWLMTNVAVWLAWQWTVIRGDMCQFQVEALKSQLMCDWPHLLFPFEWHLSSCQMLATHTSRVACAEEKWSKHQVIHWMCSMSRKSTSDSFFFSFWPCHGACKMLFPRPGISPASVQAQRPNHWTAKEVSSISSLCNHGIVCYCSITWPILPPSKKGYKKKAWLGHIWEDLGWKGQLSWGLSGLIFQPVFKHNAAL